MTTVEKIHREVDTAQDRLLQKATMIVELNKPASTQDKKIEKAERLKKLGFTAAAPIYEAEVLKEQDSFRVRTEEEAKLILHYKQEYPFLKFLTEEELDRICSKYSLIYAPVANYTGDIPEKNIRDIENAQSLKKEDFAKELVVKLNFYSSVPAEVQQWFNNHEFSRAEILDRNGQLLPDSILKTLCPIKFSDPALYKSSGNQIVEKRSKGSLYIAAPKSMFSLKGLKQHGLGYLVGYKVEKDPVVFRYVKGGIQVLTKWGIEAEDKLLQNEIEN